MSQASIRPAELIRREIAELSEYLGGLPEALRASGATQAYEARLADLQEELLLSTLVASLPQRSSALGDIHAPDAGSSWQALEPSLGSVQRRLETRLRAHARLRTTIGVAGVVVSALTGFFSASLAGSESPVGAVIAAIGVAIVAILASVTFAPVDRALE